MFSSWMLSRDTCQLLVERLQTLRPKIAVEFGSGFSTGFLALYSDTLVSLEHSAAHAAPWPCVKVCELHNGRYRASLPDGVEFALIDGPPARKYGRNETFPQLWPHLADTFEVWLDDYDRDHEQEIVADWQDRFPITVERVGSVKGLAIIRRAK